LNYHAYVNIATPTRWADYVYFDVETVGSIEEMQRVATGELERDEKLKFLNPFNAKFFAAGVRGAPNPVLATELGLSYKTYRERWTIYYNEEPMSREQIALSLLSIADRLGKRGFVAHHGKRFDFLIFLRLAGLSLRVSKGTYYLQKGKRFYSLIDTIELGKALGKLSLNELAEHFIGKGKITFEAQTLSEYNVHDVYLLMKICKAFEKLKLHATPTRTARLWLAGIMKDKGVKRIVQPKIELLDYVGGRVEVFHHKGENLYCYDANSLYPSVMSCLLHPSAVKRGKSIVVNVHEVAKPDDELARKVLQERINKEIERAPLCSPFDLLTFMNSLKWHYLLFVRIKGIRQGLEPHLETFARKYFPFSFYDERRRFVLDRQAVYQVQGYEVAFLKLFDWELLAGYFYKPSSLFFAAPMAELYKERQRLKREGNDLQLLYKIIMNSLYGTFGLRDYRVVELSGELQSLYFYVQGITKRRNMLQQSDADDFVHYRDAVRARDVLVSLTGKTKSYVQGKEFSFFSVPLWATSITSGARFWLHAVILALLSQGSKVYYVDTDSVYTDATPGQLEKIGLLGSAMLQWKLEAEIERFIAFAPKSYAYVANKTLAIKAKGTGRGLIREAPTVIVHKAKQGRIVKDAETKEVVRRFANPFALPSKIPDRSSPTWESKVNYERAPFATAFPLSMVASFMPEIADEISRIYGEFTDACKVSLLFKSLL
jgi:hypothetical protein